MNTSSKRDSRGFRFKWRWIILALIVLPFLPQMRGCVLAFTPKTGRVVDVTTGKGIPDATIIAVANISYLGGSSGGSGVYRVMTHTDADGNYRVPNTWLRSMSYPPIAPPWFNPVVHWYITALKPRYAFVGDDDAWMRYDDYGQPKYKPLSTAATPPATWLGYAIRVDPLQLKPVQLSIKQAAVYYHAIAFAIGYVGGHDASDRADDVLIEKPVYDFLLPQVCNEEPNTKMDFIEAGTLGDFVQNNDAFMKTLRELEPDGFQSGYALPVFKSPYERHVFRAGNVCLAMKADGDLQ